MSMPVSEKHFLEKIASYIPGVAGYREREGRRETDRRLREFAAGRLDEARQTLVGRRNRALDAGELEALDAIGRLDRVLQKTVAALRYADHGYSGVFDQVKILEAELDRIYAYDAALVTDVVALSERLASSQAPDPGEWASIADAAEGLDQKVARRREVLESPV